MRQWGLGADPKSAIESQIYYPFMQLPPKMMPLVADVVAVVLRTQGDPTALMGAVRQATGEVDAGGVIYGVETMNGILAKSMATRRLSMLLLGALALLALALSCVGIYGVISYLVGQRAQEIGLRMALGARRSDVLYLILGQGLRMALIGVGIGIAAALCVTRLMSNLLFGVTAHDPGTFFAVAFVLVAVTLIACYLPARRAMEVDPMVVLRRE